MLIDLSKRFRTRIREFPKSRRREIARVIDAVRDGFGAPHLHSGLGIRRLQGNYFECRAGLKLRLVFRARPESSTSSRPATMTKWRRS